ncbi:MAG: hypothetical protein NC337_06645 [Roseburia sp.]|nr:hypothetical protein [Roseburia sp.]
MKIVIVVLSFFNILMLSADIKGFDVRQQYNIEVANEKSGIVPYSDNIEVKYRIAGGKVQYRRWNISKGCWIDRDWIDM